MAKWSLLAYLALSVVSVPATAQTLADEAMRLDVQYQIMMKRKQLQDIMGPDPILSKIPQVVSVFSFGEQIRAKLMLANGVALTYGEGEVINQRMRVVAITPREVVVAITPTDGNQAKGKKAKEPVLMPLDFMAGARQMQGMNPGGLPGVPGTTVSSGPIPPGLLQAPPAIPGGNLANWPQASQQPPVSAAPSRAPQSDSLPAPVPAPAVAN